MCPLSCERVTGSLSLRLLIELIPTRARDTRTRDSLHDSQWLRPLSTAIVFAFRCARNLGKRPAAMVDKIYCAVTVTDSSVFSHFTCNSVELPLVFSKVIDIFSCGEANFPDFIGTRMRSWDWS